MALLEFTLDMVVKAVQVEIAEELGRERSHGQTDTDSSFVARIAEMSHHLRSQVESIVRLQDLCEQAHHPAVPEPPSKHFEEAGVRDARKILDNIELYEKSEAALERLVPQDRAVCAVTGQAGEGVLNIGPAHQRLDPIHQGMMNDVVLQ